MLLTTNKRCPLKLRTVATLRTCSNNRAGGVIKPCPVFLPLHPQQTLGVVYSSVLYLCPVIVLALLDCVIVYVFRGAGVGCVFVALFIPALSCFTLACLFHKSAEAESWAPQGVLVFSAILAREQSTRGDNALRPRVLRAFYALYALWNARINIIFSPVRLCRINKRAAVHSRFFTKVHTALDPNTCFSITGVCFIHFTNEIIFWWVFLMDCSALRLVWNKAACKKKIRNIGNSTPTLFRSQLSCSLSAIGVNFFY